MSESNSFASLGPTLLARKGGAKPAMRPQVAPLHGGADAAEDLETDSDHLEDLGWNDMGHADDRPHEAQVFALTPMKPHADGEAHVVDAQDEDGEADGFYEATVVEEPVVRRQQREIVSAISSRAPAGRRAANDAANNSGRRAAFTLRLDARRHLKLRLASTVKNRSAQQLVTQALDKFLADIPEIEALAAQVSTD